VLAFLYSTRDQVGAIQEKMCAYSKHLQRGLTTGEQTTVYQIQNPQLSFEAISVYPNKDWSNMIFRIQEDCFKYVRATDKKSLIFLQIKNIFEFDVSQQSFIQEELIMI